MRPRSSLFFLLTFLLLASGLSGQQAPKFLKCGTSPAMDRQQLFLHQRATERRANLLRAGQTTVGSGPQAVNLVRSASAVSGDILVMSGDGGVILGQNLFPQALLGRQIHFQPEDAAASAYRVALGDEPFRGDAIAEPAVNLMQPASGSPIGDDDSRDFDLPFPFPMFGETHSRLHVNSNGHITFGSADALASTSSYAGFLSGPPKIAGATLDLDPSGSPADAGLYVYLSATEVIVSYVRIAEFFYSNRLVDFQIRLTPDGRISILHRRGPIGQYVMGITPGNSRDDGQLIRFVDAPADPIAQSIAEIFSGSSVGSFNIFRGSQVFYQTQPDDYDFLVFYNDAGIDPGSGAVAFEITVRNEVQGIGDDIVDRSTLFGSPSRLQAVINMGPLSQYPANPNGKVEALGTTENTPLTVLAHEAGHRFLAFPRLREGATNTYSLLGRQLAHWSFRFNSRGSFLEGSHILPLPNEADRYITGSTNQSYSELDRYLMGLIPAQMVGLDQSLFYVGGLGSTMLSPRAGVEIAGPRRDFSMDDIIAANGPRVPDHTISQRRFRFAFVLVTQDMSNVAQSLAKLNVFREEFVEFFRTHTGGLASADTSLKPALELDAFPAAGILAGTQGSLRVSRRHAGDDLPLLLEVEGGSIALSTTATIPAGEAAVVIPFTAMGPGISRVRVFAADDSFLPAEAAIVATTSSQLSLTLISSSRVQAAPNSEAETPIRVRVANEQGLPIQGVNVRFEPLTGGSAMPPVVTTDSSGEASFRWTVGPESTNAARVFIEGAEDTTDVIVTALENLLPDLRAATNGASFEAGVSPGSLATLFGVSLSAGTTASASTLPLPIELEGTRVTINGMGATLIYVSDQQINFVVPTTVSGSSAQIHVNSADGQSNSFVGPLFPFQPGIFFDAGTNLGAVLPANSGQKTDVLPASPGGFVEIYATGLGPAVSGGRGRPFVTQEPVSARIADIEMQVTFSGLAPGFAGLYQVNARVPEELAPGTYPLRLMVKGVTSNEVNVIVGSAPPQ